MSAAEYDVIIIGGGHNGLTCGAYLARAGKKVLVLERRHLTGGMVVTEEFTPGFRASTFSYVMSLLHPKVIQDLELRDLGLTVLPANDMFCPLGRDDYLIFSGDAAKTTQQFGRFDRFDVWMGTAAEELCQHGPAAQRLEGVRRDQLCSRAGHQYGDPRAGLDEFTDQAGRFVSGDTTTYADEQFTTVHRLRRSSSGGPPSTTSAAICTFSSVSR